MRQEVVQSFEESVKARVKLWSLNFDKNGFTLWYWRNLEWGNHTKCINIHFHPQHWKFLGVHTNGAKRGRVEDKCFDGTFRILGVFFNYINWNYNAKYRK